MDSHQLTALLLREDSAAKSHFGGVFSIDQLVPLLQDREKRSWYYIINLSPSTEEGSHWVALYLPKLGANAVSEYFDSLGYPPQDKRLLHVLGSKYLWNTKQLQHGLSTVCGQYTLFFILQRCVGNTFHEILSVFCDSTDFLVHDYLVNQSIQRYFKIKLPLIDYPYLSDIDIDWDALPIDAHGKIIRQ